MKRKPKHLKGVVIMAGYKKLTPKEQMNLGITSRLYHEGKTPEEIAEIVKYPIETVRFWIEIIKKADIKRSEMKG